MEFNLHIVMSGSKANIAIEYDSKDKIDKEKLKEAVYEVVDCIVENKNTEFEETSVLLSNDNIKTDVSQVSSYNEFGDTPAKYTGNEIINGAVEPPNSNSNILINMPLDFITRIVESQLIYVKTNNLQE